ncbi:hypothetical protein M0R45_034866 [Rubus argutus]|uniref:RRM domain-containing protein n=1 Tax=Rubus argutus TaxID=59490 RepID=A0AAW1VV52_RUBAR
MGAPVPPLPFANDGLGLIPPRDMAFLLIGTLKTLNGNLCMCSFSKCVCPKDRVTNLHQGYGFVEFRSEEDADYVTIKVLNMIKLYGKPIRVNKASQDKKSLDVGANLVVGNLDPDVDEKLNSLRYFQRIWSHSYKPKDNERP